MNKVFFYLADGVRACVQPSGKRYSVAIVLFGRVMWEATAQNAETALLMGRLKYHNIMNISQI